MQHLYAGLIDLVIGHKQIDLDDLMRQVHGVAVCFVQTQDSVEGSEPLFQMCYWLLIEEFKSLDGLLNDFLLEMLDGCYPELH